MGLKMKPSMQESLKLAQGPLLCNEEYIRAVEAAVVAAGKGAGKGELGKDWGAALRRLLVVRKNPPLALWWAFSCVDGGVVGFLARGLDEACGLLSSASSLLLALKSFSLGTADRETAIAVLAPVLSAIFQVMGAVSKSVGLLGRAGLPEEAEEGVGRKRRKITKRVRDLVREVRCFVVLCERWEVGGSDFGPPPAPEFRMTFSSVLAVNGVKEVVPHPASFVKFPVCARARRALAGGEEVSGKTLADIVCAEVVLLQLLVEIIDWRSRLKKQKKDFESGIQELVAKLKHIAVHATAAARSSGGLDAALEMLLDHHLPVGDVLDAQEENVLRGVLYEAVLVEPPFSATSKVKSTTRQQPITFLRRLAVARLAVAWFRSKNEGTRAASLEEKMMLTVVPPHVLEWARALKTDRKPSSEVVRDNKSVLGWLLKSTDDASFKEFLEEEEKSVTCLDVFDAVEAGSRKETFFYDREGELIGSREEEEELPLEDADRAFASAADSIKQSHEPVLGRTTSEEVIESASDSSDDGGEAGDKMEDDDTAEKPSTLKRPRQERSSTAIVLSSTDESDEITEMSARKAKKLRREESEVLRGGSDVGLTGVSIDYVKDQVEELQSTKLGAEVKDSSMVDLTDSSGLLTAPESQGDDVSPDVGQKASESAVVEQDQSSPAACAPSESKPKAEDVADGLGTTEDSNCKQGDDPGRETSIDLIEVSTPLKRGRVTRKGGSTPKPSRKTASKQNGGLEVVVTPKKEYMTRSKQEADGNSRREIPTTSTECYPEQTIDAHGDAPDIVTVSEEKRQSPRPKGKDQSVSPLPSSRTASQDGVMSPAPSVKEGPVPGNQERHGDDTPQPVPGVDAFSTPLAGTRRRKRLADVELSASIEPRVTRSGRILGLTPTVDRSSKKSRKGKPLILEPLLDTTTE